MIKNDWKIVRIKDIGRVVTGKTPSRNNPEYFGDIIPFLTPSDMNGNRSITSPLRRLSEEGASALSRLMIPKGVGVSCIGWQMGKSILITSPSITNQQINAIINNEKVVDRVFLYYVMSSRRKELFRLASGGSRTPILKKTDFENLPFFLPPLPEQKAIARILGSLDDKIELNRKMNQTLEQIARAIFKSWFVDFDPVRVKMDGQQPVGMDAATAELFPNSFEDSTLGKIPKGWKVSPLKDICESIFSGGTPRTKNLEYWNGDIPWLSSGETRNRFVITSEKTITDLGVQNSSTRLARARSTVIASAGQGNTRGQTSLLMIDTYINQSTVALVANETVISDLFLFFDLSGRYDEFRQISDSHSSRGSLTTKLLAGVKIVTPKHETVLAFDKIAEPIVERISANLSENTTLSSLRDTLLPKLISGEIRVTEAEKQIENVL